MNHTLECNIPRKYGKEYLSNFMFTVNCSKVKADEENTFHSADMVPPDLRSYDVLSRQHPHQAIRQFKGNSLLLDCYTEMEPFTNIRRSGFVCCSSKKGFISFYAQCPTEQTSSALTLRHHLTLEMKHLFLDDQVDLDTKEQLDLLSARLEEAVDPSIKGIRLLENIMLENRGAILMGFIFNFKAYVGQTRKKKLKIIKKFPALDFVQYINPDFVSRFNRSGLPVFIFNDSVEDYKQKIEATT